MTTTTATKNTSATTLKGIAATAAGVAVLLGGIGTFALWNTDVAIGSAGTATGNITAELTGTTWEDLTPGHQNPITHIGAFRMVPGDVITGTALVDVTATGENLLVLADFDGPEGTELPPGIIADVSLADSTGNAVSTLAGSNEGTVHNLKATVTLSFDADATESKSELIDLSTFSVGLQQVLVPRPAAP